MTVHLTEEDMKAIRAAAYWHWAEDHPEEAAARLGCGLAKPAEKAAPAKVRKPKRRYTPGSSTQRREAHMRRIRRLG